MVIRRSRTFAPKASSLAHMTLKKPEQAPVGRICACGTRLSVYNHSNECATCTRKKRGWQD